MYLMLFQLIELKFIELYFTDCEKLTPLRNLQNIPENFLVYWRLFWVTIILRKITQYNHCITLQFPKITQEYIRITLNYHKISQKIISN